MVESGNFRHSIEFLWSVRNYWSILPYFCSKLPACCNYISNFKILLKCYNNYKILFHIFHLSKIVLRFVAGYLVAIFWPCKQGHYNRGGLYKCMHIYMLYMKVITWALKVYWLIYSHHHLNEWSKYMYMYISNICSVGCCDCYGGGCTTLVL